MQVFVRGVRSSSAVSRDACEEAKRNVDCGGGGEDVLVVVVAASRAGGSDAAGEGVRLLERVCVSELGVSSSLTAASPATQPTTTSKCPQCAVLRMYMLSYLLCAVRPC